MADRNTTSLIGRNRQSNRNGRSSSYKDSEGPSTAILKPARHGGALLGALDLQKKEERQYLCSALASSLQQGRRCCPASLHFSRAKDKDLSSLAHTLLESGSLDFINRWACGLLLKE